MKRRFYAGLLVAGLSALSGSTAATAQVTVTPAPAPLAPQPQRLDVVPVDERSAQDTRQRLNEILRDYYPPSLTQVLRLDPTLLNNPGYLAPYPALAAYIAQHPEVSRHAAFYLGPPNFNDDNRGDPNSQAIREFGEVMGNALFLCGIIAFFVTVGWLGRLIVEHRRWLRATKTQTDAHSKLLERLTSNEDLLAYIQTPAAQHFLEAAPIPLDATPRSIGAPISRILWSVQAGIVLAVVGLGLWFVRYRIFDEISGPLMLVSTLAMALGVGFALSAVVAYMLSLRLGLLEPPKP
jgi:hypothetical protein